MARSTTTPRKFPTDAAQLKRIVAEARRQFLSHGFRGVTMDDLAAQLGMSKKTLYGAFADKGALLEAVVQDKFRSVDADLEELIADTAPDALDSLAAVLACLQRHMAEIQPSFLRDLERQAPE